MAQVSYQRTVASDNVVKYFQSSSIVRIKVTKLLKHPFNKYVEIVDTWCPYLLCLQGVLDK